MDGLANTSLSGTPPGVTSVSTPAASPMATLPLTLATASTPVNINKSASPAAATAAGASNTASSPNAPMSTVSASTASSVPIVLSSANLPHSDSSHTVRPASVASSSAESKVLDKRRLQELVKEVDPLEQLDDDVEEMLMQIADDFIEDVVMAACQLAKHRRSNTVEVKDVQLHLERHWNLWVPGFGSDDMRPYKKAATTEAHKQRMALIKKTLKKY